MNAVIKSLLSLGILTLTGLIVPVQVFAQDYPNKPIKILIPFPPGGGTDFVSRLVGNKLAEMTKWTVVLDNKLFRHRQPSGGNRQ